MSIHNIIQQKRHKRNFMSGVGISNPKKYTLPNEYEEIKYITTRLCDDLNWTQDWNAPFRPGYSTIHDVNNGYIHGLNTNFYPNHNTKIEIWGRLGRPYNHGTDDYRYQMLFGATGDSGNWSDNNSFDYYLTRGSSLNNSMPYYRWGSTKADENTDLATVGWYTNGRGRALNMYVKGTIIDSESNPDPTNVYAGYFKLVCDKNVWTYTLWGRAIDWEDATEEDYADLFSDTAVQGNHYCIYKAQKTITDNKFQCKSPLYLLHTPRELTSTSPKTPTTFRVPAIDLYGCKIWDDGNLVRDYAPVRNKLGTAGLFDKITNTFITDPNIKGCGKAIKPGQSRVISLESIEFTGEQAICIDDYIPNIYTNIELKLKLNNIASKNRIFWSDAEGVGSNTSKMHYGLYIMTGLKFAFLFRGQGYGSTSTERRGWSKSAAEANINSLYMIKYNTGWCVKHKTGSVNSPTSHYIESIDFNTGVHCVHPHLLGSGYTFITGIDDANSEYYNPDFSAASPLYIGENSTDANIRPYMHLYYFKIYEHSRTDSATTIDLNSSSDNKTLIHDLIPLEIDGEPGLYDKITHKFYTSYVPNTSFSKVLSNYYESYIECVYIDRDHMLEDPKPLIFKNSNAYINKDMSFIEYIENIDMSYIDTGYVPSGNDIVIKGKFMPKGYSGIYGGWFGSDLVNNISRYGICAYSLSSSVYTKILAACGKNKNLAIDVAQVNIISNWQDYEFDMSFNQFNYRINNGSWISIDMPSGNVSGTPTATFKIFRASDHVAYGRLYYLQLYKGSTLIYDLVPVSINGKGYLYNKVNGNILGDDTNNFVLGPITDTKYINVSILDSTNSGLIDYVEVINEKRLRGNKNELTALMNPPDTWLYQYSLSCTEYKTRTKTRTDRYIWVDDLIEGEEYDIYNDLNQYNKYHYVGTMEFENNTYYVWDNEAYNFPDEHFIILTSVLDYTGRTLEDDINNRSGFDFMLAHDNTIIYNEKENPDISDNVNNIVMAYRQYILPQFNYSGISERSNIVRFYLKNRFVIDRYTFENFHRISLLEFVPYYIGNYWANMYWINSNTPYLKCIADGAFKNASNMAPANADSGHIHFPSTLTSIASEAFSNVLALNGIDFTDTNVITIGSKAFAYSSGATTYGESVEAIGLNSVTLSPTITSIASDTFTGCDMISKINIYNQQQIDVFQNAFIDSINRPTNQLLHDQTTGSLNKLTITSSSATEGISIPNSFLNHDEYNEINLSYLSLYTNNNSYFAIGEYAFWGCGLKTVRLDVSNNNAYIGEGAFGNNTLLSTIEIHTENNNGDTCNPPTYWTYNTTTYTYTYHTNIFANTKLAISGQGQAYIYFMGDPTINPIKPIADQWKNFLTYNKIHTNNIHLENLIF